MTVRAKRARVGKLGKGPCGRRLLGWSFVVVKVRPSFGQDERGLPWLHTTVCRPRRAHMGEETRSRGGRIALGRKQGGRGGASNGALGTVDGKQGMGVLCC